MSLRVSVTYVAWRGIAGALNVVTLAYLARAYGPAEYAKIALAIGAALLTSSAVYGPLRSALARFSEGYGKDQAILANVFTRASFAVALVGLIAACIDTVFAAFALASTCLAIAQGAFDYAVQHATSKFAPDRVGRLYLTKATLSISIAAIVVGSAAPAWAAVGGLALATTAAVLSFGRAGFDHAWTPLRDLAPSRVREIVVFAAPLAVVGVLVFAAQWADRAIVGAMLGARTFGAYVAVADLMQQLVGMLFSGVGAAWYPRLVEATARDDKVEQARLFVRYVELMWILLVPAIVGLAVVSSSLASVVFGDRYAIDTAWPPLLAIGAGFAGMKAFLLDVPLFLRKRTTLHAGIVALTAATSTGLAFLLVPLFGVYGAAGAFCAATIVGCLASWAAMRTFGPIVPRANSLVGVAVGCGLMFASAASIVAPEAARLAAAVAAGAIVYGTALWLLDVSDVRAFGRTLVSSLGVKR